MKPQAWVKSANFRLRWMASRPGTSFHSLRLASAAVRAVPVSLAVMAFLLGLAREACLIRGRRPRLGTTQEASVKLIRRTAILAAAAVAVAAARLGPEERRHAAHPVRRRRAQRRHVLQQPAHRADPGPPGVGHAGASRSRDLRDQAGARHRLEVRRGQLARPHHPPGREVPRRQHALARRRGLHHQHGGQSRQQGGDAVELCLDRQGREDRRLDRAHQDEAADAGGAGISRHGDADPSQGLSREGRARGLRRQAGRRRSLQDRQERAGQGGRVRALRGLLGRLAQGQAGDQDAACALRARCSRPR